MSKTPFRLAGAAAVCLGIALSGCTTAGILAASDITQGNLDAARSAYDAGFLAPAALYRSLPVCAPGQEATFAIPCAVATTIAKLQVADEQAEQAFNAVQSLLSSGQSQNVAAEFSALMQTIAAAEDLAKALGAN